jgi:hypothetical protein
MWEENGCISWRISKESSCFPPETIADELQLALSHLIYTVNLKYAS